MHTNAAHRLMVISALTMSMCSAALGILIGRRIERKEGVALPAPVVVAKPPPQKPPPSDDFKWEFWRLGENYRIVRIRMGGVMTHVLHHYHYGGGQSMVVIPDQEVPKR